MTLEMAHGVSPELAAVVREFNHVVCEFNDAQAEVAPFDGAVNSVYVVDKGIRIERREVDFVASTPDKDSQDDIVEQDFLFERFFKNPVILFAHDRRSLPIGRAENVRVEGGLLRLTVVFASKAANPMAENVFLLIKEKILKAMSIGFIPRDIRRELRDGEEVWILSRNELIEASVVPIPANENALAELKAKALDRAAKTALSPPRAQEQSATGGEEKAMSEMLNKQIEELTKARDATVSELDAMKARYASLEGLYSEEGARKQGRVGQCGARRGCADRQEDQPQGKGIAREARWYQPRTLRRADGGNQRPPGHEPARGERASRREDRASRTTHAWPQGRR